MNIYGLLNLYWVGGWAVGILKNPEQSLWTEVGMVVQCVSLLSMVYIEIEQCIINDCRDLHAHVTLCVMYFLPSPSLEF